VPGLRGLPARDGTEARTYPQALAAPVESALEWIRRVVLDERRRRVGSSLVAAVEARLRFLVETGVGYLQLDRAADTLSGGETQRVRLAAQLGAGLTGVLYVLDEPTIGLHARDTVRLLAILRRLAGEGSTVVVVEHDAQVIRAADHIVDLGPGGGVGGGRVVAMGPPAVVEADAESPTGRYLRRASPLATPARRALAGAPLLALEGVRARNLDGVDVEFPIGRLTAVTGVSGSGKSTLVREVLRGVVEAHLRGGGIRPRGVDRVAGVEVIDRLVEVDQSPIGRTSRSVPATYVGIWDEIRSLLAATPLARSRGFGPERFSFNREGGRCEACGQGFVRVEMAFLPDAEAACETCGGARFEPATREVSFRGHSADRLLAATVDEAAEVFAAVARVARPLALMRDLGLGYLRLGQPSSTLSGGEGQRLKLVAELGQRGRGRTLYLLDEPTTGLHGVDVERLVATLGRLVDRGDTVVVVEHHLDLIWAADHVIDLGPEGGAGGGRVVAAGSPEFLAAASGSHTGAALRALRGGTAAKPT
jgi:excinuclease ABC subunit A